MKRNTVYFYPIVDERERKIVSPVGTCHLTIISNLQGNYLEKFVFIIFSCYPVNNVSVFRFLSIEFKLLSI